MREINKDIFTCTDGYIIIPTNVDTINKNGKITAVMGRGLAKLAAEIYPELPAMLGDILNQRKNDIFDIRVFRIGVANIICLPTKKSWKDSHAKIELIYLGLHQLKRISDHLYPQKFYLPKIGCGKGTGNLDWDADVKPVVNAIFWNDKRFILVEWP